jgi:hypothetical protein
MANPDEDAIMAQADKDLEERANRAKEILSMRYKSLRQDQVRREQKLMFHVLLRFLWRIHR